MTAKKLIQVHETTQRHWVGDGFPVRTVFDYGRFGRALSPFLMMDYAGPLRFEPARERRGVGEHPHRGFETVTIVYQGEVEHRDSAGNSGKIGPGDVQWMTAASGVVHEEMHSRAFTEKGGTMEMVQLWVNLPAKDKMSKPAYQEILDRDIPVVSLDGEAGTARLIAGELGGRRGPARTHTPLNLWDLRLKGGREVSLPVSEGHTASVFVLKGELTLEGGEKASEAQIAIFDRAGKSVTFTAQEGTVALLLSGEPIDEPIAGYGPFVMNSRQEIQQAVLDYQSGRMGHLS